MRYSLLALGAGSMAVAMFTNTTDSPAADKAVANTMPPAVGDYELFGCALADEGIKSLSKVASTKDMDVDFCGASCQSKFMAVSGNDCFCGETADTAQKVDAAMCNSPCPGNQAQSCGGNGGNTRRDAVAAAPAPMKAVSMYVRAKAGEAGGPITRTVTRVDVATITKCHPTVTNCPASKATQVVTQVVDACPRQPQAIEWHKKKIICYGGHCAHEVPCECQKQRVVCDGAKCHSEYSHSKEWSSLVVCKGDDCKWSTSDDNRWYEEKIVCYGGKCAWEKCHSDECHKKLVCRGDECKHEKCSGDECHKKFICDHKGDHCKPAAPCSGQCPKPPPPCHDKCAKQPPPPCHGESCKAVPCSGHNCAKPVHPTATGSIYPHHVPTSPPIVGGAGSMVANVIGVAAGLLFIL
ncbi:Carbohydrate-binding WSC [Metarhizium album ARSEF 1941]|uniref:Carbohydrate-binding WSC n=1 Tax=Metarhizium album (strain ARSEF 1941) TaxID=1081103 RepID=A0A0B2X7X1_METAS|nr:Carbohydrate-binding WSC [Metarhizium album ARSEF 1941]KHO01605.1 Carbohydrate-binding WSC [Metarhizium album ARSEF 1941]